jgi:flagellar motor switch protein FliM
MNQQILSQDEVDALLQGITGESQKLEQEEAHRRLACATTTSPARSASSVGACPRWRSSTSASRATSASGCSTSSARARGVHRRHQGAEVQRLPARDRGADQLQHRQRPPAARLGLIVCDPTLVFAVIDALFGGAGKFHTRIEGRDFSPTEQRVILRLVECIMRRVQEGLAGHLPAGAGPTSARRCSRSSPTSPRPARSWWPSFTLEIGETSGSIHFCIPYSTLEPIRDVLYSTIQGDSVEPDRRWVNLLKQQIQSAEVDLVAELATRRPRWSSCWPSSRATSSSWTWTR